MIFLPRTKCPDKNDPLYYSNQNIFHKCGYGLPNCTAYAYGRFKEITGVWLPCRGNAEDWIAEADKKDY